MPTMPMPMPIIMPINSGGGNASPEAFKCLIGVWIVIVAVCAILMLIAAAKWYNSREQHELGYWEYLWDFDTPMWIGVVAILWFIVAGMGALIYLGGKVGELL